MTERYCTIDKAGVQMRFTSLGHAHTLTKKPTFEIPKPCTTTITYACIATRIITSSMTVNCETVVTWAVAIALGAFLGTIGYVDSISPFVLLVALVLWTGVLVTLSTLPS